MACMGMTSKLGNPTLSPEMRMDESLSGETRKFSKVLLVDDSKFLADILAMFFQLDGYSARAAYGGEHAIAAVEDEVPDIAFIDIDMPDMNGLDLARHIRASKRARGTVLVALSGWEEEKYKRNAMEAGFDHFLAKPVDAPAIREFMRWLSSGE
jgi:CheY-like chemotaxis protein